MTLSFEGIGTNGNETVFKALAILHYDPSGMAYRLKSFVKEGLFKDAYFKVVEENKYEWGFDVPTGKIRYMITLDPSKKTWYETGEYSGDGNTWMKFIEINLVKQG